MEALGGVIRPVMDGTCRIGIVGSLPVIPDELASEPLIDLPFITVVSPSHPLARHKGSISKKLIEKQIQLVLTDRTPLSDGRSFGVLSPLTWRLADLGAKHAFLNAGLGWGHMPLHMVKKDLDAGNLVRIKVEGIAKDTFLPMHIVYRKDALPGPTGRAFISQLRC